ncbi:MAG TPA: hypothetical protein VEI83_09380 [Acidimicrobiales bacterium]|nr:hypothetical protein [Acidimicrobiales bacterium]
MAAVGAGALVLAGAAAFTNGLSFSNTNTTVAYGQENVQGATVTSINYTLDATRVYVDTVTFAASGDTSGSTAEVGFSTGSQGAGNTTTNWATCGAGAFSSGSTTYVCDVSNLLGSGQAQAVAGITATDIVVH